MPDEVPSQETNWEAELSAAFASDPDFNNATEQPAPAPVPETPAGDPAPAVQPPADPPPAPSEPPAPPVDTFDGGEFNPDLLDPSLQPGWRQLQGAFTRKTQELAEQRRELEAMAQQFGGADPEAAAQALQLYSAVNDPTNWPALVAELQGLMEANGIPMPGVAPATPEPPATPPLVPAAEVDDPELAPLMERINALQTQIDGFNARAQEQAMIAQAERAHAQRVAQFEAQESRIKELYPNYKESDWESIYTRVPFFNGDLIAAQQNFESERQRHVEAYLAGKQGAQGAGPATPPAVTPTPPPADRPVTLRDVEEAAVEHLRALQAAGELDV